MTCTDKISGMNYTITKEKAWKFAARKQTCRDENLVCKRPTIKISRFSVGFRRISRLDLPTVESNYLQEALMVDETKEYEDMILLKIYIRGGFETSSYIMQVEQQSL